MEFLGGFEGLGLGRFRDVFPVGTRMVSLVGSGASVDTTVTPEMMAQVDNFTARTTTTKMSGGGSTEANMPGTGTGASTATGTSLGFGTGTGTGTGTEPNTFFPPLMFAYPPPPWLLTGMPATPGLSFPPPPPPPPSSPSSCSPQPVPVPQQQLAPQPSPAPQPAPVTAPEENTNGDNANVSISSSSSSSLNAYAGGLDHLFLQIKQLMDIQDQERMNWYTHSDQILRATRLIQHMLDENSLKHEDEATVLATARLVASTAAKTSTNQERVLLGEQQRQVDLEFAMLQRLVAASRDEQQQQQQQQQQQPTPQPQVVVGARNDGDGDGDGEEDGPQATLSVIRTDADTPSSILMMSPRSSQKTVYQYTLRL